jgi:hypothetical protein
MNHLNVYVDLITKAQSRILFNRIGYHHHHILPSAMGGTDDPDNLVFLTPKEHMLAHTLLAFSYPNQWGAVEMIGLRSLHKLPKWKRRRIAHWRAQLQRAARVRSFNHK